MFDTHIERKSEKSLQKAKEKVSDPLKKAVETNYNKTWPDGRIYGLDKEGKYISHSVVSTSEVFDQNIEMGVKPLVKALNQKEFFTISSCQGHSLWDKRYVSVIFPSFESATHFFESLPFNLSFRLKHASEYFNAKINLNRYGNLESVQKVEPGQNDFASYIDLFVGRPYKDAWILEIILIGESTKFGFLDAIKRFFQKRKAIDLTHKLEKHIRENTEVNRYWYFELT